MTYYISLHVGPKRLVFHLSPRDGHVITVSGCLILTDVNLIILIRMAYIIDRLVSSCARSSVTFDIGLHEMCVQVRVRYVIIKFFLGWILYQILLPMVLRCPRLARARAPLLS